MDLQGDLRLVSRLARQQAHRAPVGIPQEQSQELLRYKAIGE